MAKKIVIVLLIMSLSLTSGCWNQISVNDTAIASGIGVDFTDSGQISFVVQLNKPVNQQTAIQTSQFVVASGTGDTMVEAGRKIMLSLPRFPLWSHADIFVIGEKLARKDLSVLLDFLFRNRNIRMNSTVLVTHNTSLQDMYNSDCPLSLCSARGILNILRTQEKLLGIYVPVTLHEFIVKATTPGIDPVCPMVSVTKDLKDKNILTLNGTAIFRGQRMVGVLDVIESRGLYWLTSTKKTGAIIVVTLPQNPEVKVTLELDQMKTKIRPRIEDNQIFMDISLNGNFDLREISGNGNQQDINLIEETEKAAEEEIKSQIRACILKGQELNSDFLGFGRNIYRYYPRHWQKVKDDWHNYYPQVETNIDVKVALSFSELVKNNIVQDR